MPTSEELKVRGNQALQAGNLEDAVSAYTEAIALDASNHVLYSNRSAAYASQQQYELALNDAEECIKLMPNWVKGYTRKATALEFLSRYSEAKKVYEDILKMEPSNSQAVDSLKNIQPKLRVEELLLQAAKNPKLKSYLKDPAYLKKIEMLISNPAMMGNFLEDEQIKETLMSSFGASGMDFDGEDEMDQSEGQSAPARAKTPEPEKSKVSETQQKAFDQKELGNASYKKKDFDTALKHYDAAIDLEPENITFYNNKAAVFFEKKLFDECIELCHRAVEIGRENRADYKLLAKSYARIGHCYERKEDLQQAQKFYDKSLSEFRAPDIIKKAQSVKRLLEEKARVDYISPEKAEEAKALGNRFFSEGKYPEALKNYSEAIRRNPTDAKLYSNRAACYSKLMEFQCALADCDKCIELDADFIKGHLRKGSCLVAMRDFNQARKAFRRALEIDPNCTEAQEGLRQSYSSDTDPEAARQRAMNDPEIINILSDPAMRMILNQMEDPAAVREHLANPEIASKLYKLIDAGLVQIK